MRYFYVLFFSTLFLVSLNAKEDQENIEALEYYYKGQETAYTNRDSTYYYYGKSMALFKEDNDLNNELSILQLLLYVNGYYYDLKSLKKNLDTFQELINQEDAKKLQDYSYFYDSYYLEQINYNFKLSNLPLAQKYIDSLTSYMQTRELQKRDMDYYEIILSKGLYEGSIYKAEGKPNLAVEKYNELRNFIKTHSDSLYDGLESEYSVNRLQAKVYASLKQYDKAIFLEQQALDFSNDNENYINSRMDLQMDLAQNFMEVGNLKEATSLIEKLDKANIQKPRFKVYFLAKKAQLALLKNNKNKNRGINKERIEQIVAYRNTEKHPDVINAYIMYAKDELHWGDIDSAFSQLNYASTLFPNTSEINNSFTLTKLRLALASRYLKTYQATEHPEKFAEEILTKTQDIIASLDILQPQFESKLDKQYLINNAYPSLQNAFVLMYALYKKTQKRDYLDQAFAISEKSKAIELRSIRQAGVAQQTLNISPKIIETENLFNYTINQLEKDLFTQTKNNQALQDSLLQQKEAYGDFVADLKDSNPSYYNLRFNYDVSTLSQSVDDLAKNTAAISYFQVATMMYAIVIDKDNPRIVQIPYPEETQQDIRHYYNKISEFTMGGQDAINTLSKSLYKKFVASCFPNSLPKSLTIIPDGLLFYLPFEALNSGKQYVVQTTSVSYKPSVSFMQGLHLDKPYPATFYGFAPHFEANDLLTPLAYNEQEVEQAAAHFTGSIFRGEEGSLSRFRESVHKNFYTASTPIYHLATHAITNDTLPEYSYLAFTPKTANEDYILYAKDLYTEQLNGAMVVLSACETGLGKLENGQGMQSLAQGFYYAGASSLLYSKWKVSDRYTAEMMNLFYENLEQGLPKDKALQQAKIQYLNTVDDPNLKHPFYWASFVFSGDNTPLEHSSLFPLWILILGSVLVLLLALLLVRSRIIRPAAS